MKHDPVLFNEILEVLNPQPGQFFVDGTLDGGGHAREIIKRISPGGTFLGIDWDEKMINHFKSQITNNKSQIILVHDNFKNIPMILKNKKLGKADGILLDLGFSSEQLAHAGRGFSFQKDEPLLMTYDSGQKPVWQWLEELSEEQLAKIIKEFGQEKFAFRIAKAIKKNLPIKTSGRLAEIVRNAAPFNYERGRIHPATRTFQALRIFVNQELENLKDFLNGFTDNLKPGGRLGIISFHSLEDRIVKNSFRNSAKEKKVAILTKKPVRPPAGEISANPRSRSAKFRAIQKL